ncbi:MAG: Dam family site-specific DNA-(adenine-N6)-methyltransferase [Bacteroidales bacterium]|nr:Dam family site-specific DNA-(adenine-N6)-methyltransferase [Bacteroidales bacterium]
MTPSKKHNKFITARPFVKWVGGKGKIVRELESLLPTAFDDIEKVTYIEPFVGGGAMLFYMLQAHKCIKRAVINDINPDLIRCYDLIAHAPQILIEELRVIENNYYSVAFSQRRELFYAYRELYNNGEASPDERAALLIFLNHTCFNGLYRVNAYGKFNVPYGRYKNPIICNEELIMADHKLLTSVELIIRQPGDYKLVKRNLSKNSINFVYLDPPYRPLSITSSFKEYSNAPFDDKQQVELKSFCNALSSNNCLIMQSNSDSKNESGVSFFEELYKGYYFNRILAPRFINANGEKREKLTEVVIRNYNH